MLLRATHTALVRTVGADDNGALAIESHPGNALLNLGEYVEAETLGRGMVEKMRLNAAHPRLRPLRDDHLVR